MSVDNRQNNQQDGDEKTEHSCNYRVTYDTRLVDFDDGEIEKQECDDQEPETNCSSLDPHNCLSNWRLADVFP